MDHSKISLSESKLKRLKIIGVLSLLVLGGGLFYYFKFNSMNNFSYAGTVEATHVNLPSRVATVIEDIVVQEGDAVKKGQLLATLACEELKIASQRANDDFERMERLRASHAASQEAYELISAKKQEMDMRMSWCRIESPIDGTVLDRFLEPKEWVNPGSKIISVADLQHLWAFVYVSAEEAARLQLNQLVQIEIPELDEQTMEGRIQKINQEAEFTPKNVQTRSERTRLVYGIKIALENNNKILKPGMTVEVRFVNAD